MPENIRHLAAVRRAESGLRRICRVVRMLIEVVVESLRFAEARLHPRPRPGMPAECRITGQIAGRLGHGSPANWIDLEKRVSVGVIALVHAVDVLLRKAKMGEAGALIGVVANKDGRVVEFLRTVERVLVRRDHPAIDDGPRKTACGSQQFLRRQFTEFGDGLGTGVECEGLAVVLGAGEGPHVLARATCGPWRTKGPAALRDSPVKQALGKWRSAKLAYSNAAGRFPKDRDLVWVAAKRRDVL